MNHWALVRPGFYHRLWMKVFFLLMIASLAACSPAGAQQPAATPTVAVTATQAPTETQAPSPTATLAPTSTPEPTSTSLPPTATPVPPLAVAEDGVNIWCAPLDYAGTKATGPEEPDYARKMIKTSNGLQASIPGAYCVVAARFNQAAPEGLALQFAEGKSVFLKQPLAVADNQADVAWTSVTHGYVMNPPLWWVDYNLSIVREDGKEIWSSPVRFAKPLPETCIYGGLPDPVTLWCTKTDPWEIEPHPDVTYPYDRTRLTPDP